MNYQFTPGPWRIAFGSEITTSPIGIVEGSKHVADCRNPLKTEIENAANARLICAAPELLAALEDSLIFIEHSGHPNAATYLEQAKPAILKAVAK